MFGVDSKKSPNLFASPVPLTSSMGPARFEDWNRKLAERAKEFAKLPDVTVLYYSSYVLFQRLLSEPQLYHFPKEDARKAGGSIWMDRLHPTGATHNVLSDDMLKFFVELDMLP